MTDDSKDGPVDAGTALEATNGSGPTPCLPSASCIPGRIRPFSFLHTYSYTTRDTEFLDPVRRLTYNFGTASFEFPFS